jgi:hypothetical protein
MGSLFVLLDCPDVNHRAHEPLRFYCYNFDKGLKPKRRFLLNPNDNEPFFKAVTDCSARPLALAIAVDTIGMSIDSCFENKSGAMFVQSLLSFVYLLQHLNLGPHSLMEQSPS